MAAATLTETPESLLIPPDDLYRLSVEQYHQIAEAGILTTEDRVELIEGILVKKMTIYPLHAFSVESVADKVKALALPGWCYRSQQPITLSSSEPEPDGSLVRGRHADYRERHPAPPEIGIVIEVVESSLPADRGVKKRVYARAGIPAYWIVNVVEKTIESFSDPMGNSYQVPKVVRLGEQMPVMLDGKVVGEISVAALFGE